MNQYIEILLFNGIALNAVNLCSSVSWSFLMSTILLHGLKNGEILQQLKFLQMSESGFVRFLLWNF